MVKKLKSKNKKNNEIINSIFPLKKRKKKVYPIEKIDMRKFNQQIKNQMDNIQPTKKENFFQIIFILKNI